MGAIRRMAGKTIPLCFLTDGRMVVCKNDRVLVFNKDEEEICIPIPVNIKERIFGNNRLLNRLFRFGIRAAIALDDQNILLSRGNTLYELNLSYGQLSQGWYCGDGVRPLQFSEVRGIKGFDDGIYFGGYVHNYEKNPVSIYRRKTEDDWDVVYTFPKGTINHVHNIVADPYRHCLWIFTGDFGDAAAIWKVTDGFNKVEYYAGGNQCWRGSLAFVTKEGLLYATDTPRADDYLYSLNPLTKELQVVMPLPGSCIYGCQWKDNYVLATTVESEGGDMGFFEKWFGRKRGKGIKDEYVHMYCGNIKDGFKEIYKEKKDWLPFTLFQFGVFKFPAGVNNCEALYFQPVATNKNDQRLMVLK